MAGLVALVNAISNDVVAKIAAANGTPLADGAIVIGRVRWDENSAPPRIVFVPRKSRFEPRSNPVNVSPRNPVNPLAPGSGVASFFISQRGSGYTSGTTVSISAPDVAGGQQATATATFSSALGGAITSVVPATAGSGYLNPPTVTINGTGTGAAATANLQPTPQAIAVALQRSIMTEVVCFDVFCWGEANPPDPNNDFDATQQLYQQVIASLHLLAPGIIAVGSGEWLDSKPGAMQLSLKGHAFLFSLEIKTPVLDTPIVATAGPPVQQAPANTQAVQTTTIVPFAGGTPEAP